MIRKYDIEKAELESLHNLLEETRRELERRYNDLEAIYHIVRAIHRALDMGELTKVVGEIMENVLHMDRYSLMIFDFEKRQILFNVGKNLNETIANYILSEVDNYVPELTAEQEKGKAIRSLGAMEDGNLALLCLPLNAQETVAGSLCATTDVLSRFNKQDINVVSIITTQIAIAVESKRLYNLTKELSITDETTDVYNYRHFQRRLSIELERAKRFNRPLSLVIMAIDDFSSYLETFGTEKANHTLHDLGSILNNHCRRVDTVARFGEAEFVLILPETDESGTLVVAEKLRKAVAECLFWGQKERDQKLTASLGAACYPQHLVEQDRIIARAKEALTRAQKMGKNRTILAKREIVKT